MTSYMAVPSISNKANNSDNVVIKNITKKK